MSSISVLRRSVFVSFLLLGPVSLSSSADSVSHSQDGILYRKKCLVTEDALKDLKEKKRELDQREDSLKSLEKDLAAKEEFLKAELGRLEELRKSISILEETEKGKQEERIAKVVTTLERMSPTAAAKIFGTLDDTIAVNAMSKIETVKLAKIMNKLPPKRSSHLAELMAGKRKMSHRQLSSKEKMTKKNEKGGSR